MHLVQPDDPQQLEPEELSKLGPRNLSFWVASNFRETPQQQQVLLQVSVTSCPAMHSAQSFAVAAYGEMCQPQWMCMKKEAQLL